MATIDALTVNVRLDGFGEFQRAMARVRQDMEEVYASSLLTHAVFTTSPNIRPQLEVMPVKARRVLVFGDLP